MVFKPVLMVFHKITVKKKCGILGLIYKIIPCNKIFFTVFSYNVIFHASPINFGNVLLFYEFFVLEFIHFTTY